MSTLKVNALRHTGGSSDNINLDSSAHVLVGTSTSSGAGANIQSVGTHPLELHRGVASTGGPNVSLSKSRNATYGSNTIVQSGDTLGTIQFRGDDGTDYVSAAAYIQGQVDGTPGSNDMPGRLVFSTTADGATSPTEAMRIDSSQNLRFNSGYGSVATAFGVRAWVNFNGTGTLAIRSSGNCSSITDVNTGRYQFNFATAMPDAEYAAIAEVQGDTAENTRIGDTTYSTSQFRIETTSSGNTNYGDSEIVNIIVVR